MHPYRTLMIGFSIAFLGFLLTAGVGFLTGWIVSKRKKTKWAYAGLGFIVLMVPMFGLSGLILASSARSFLGQSFIVKGTTFTKIEFRPGQPDHVDNVVLKRNDGATMSFMASPTVGKKWDDLLLSKKIGDTITKEEILIAVN